MSKNEEKMNTANRYIHVNNEVYSLNDVLFVFALPSESGQLFNDYHVCYTGIGKVRATYYLQKAIQQYQPKLIVNLGSAGSHVYSKGQMIVCTQFIQRDMDLTALGFRKYETPFCTDPIILSNGLPWKNLPEAVCGSGDQFETQLQTKDFQVVDMEAFALAWVARESKIPFLCIKYITDGANDQAIDDWKTEIIQVPEQFKRLLEI